MGTPIVFRINPAANALLIAQVQAAGTPTRLVLYDAQGNILVQSDGASATDPDDLIEQNLTAGTDYLALASLGAAGRYTLTASLASSA